MSMKPEFFCCIGAELKDEMAGSLKSSRIFMYRAAENQTITDMLADGFFNEADDLRINDLILLYCPEEEESNAFARVSSFSGGVVKTTKLKGPSDLDFVKKTGDTMSGALKMRDYLAFQKIQGGTAIYIEQTSNALVFKQGLIYNNIQMSLGQESVSIHPYTNGGTLGKSNAKWETLYASKLNNGANLVIPNKAGTLATMGDVELAARSGTQLTDQGVWYAKMYAATVAPAAENGTNYADFSQVDGQGNPIIVTYNRVNGAWVQDQTITPPAEYDGYVLVTSKIWDIVEQTGQQGGRILWNHTSKEFTPYPQIISFENINVTGDSTVDMPQNPGANQIVNKDYVDNQIPPVNDPTITITQGGVTMGSFSLNQSTGDTIALDAGTLDPHRVIEFQAPTADNNYTWYRKYADGWVEQGGLCSTSGTGGTNNTVTLPITMADTSFRPLLTRSSGATNTQVINYWSRLPTTADTFVIYTSSGTDVYWEVRGMAA